MTIRSDKLPIGSRVARRGSRHLGADPTGALRAVPGDTRHVVRLTAPPVIAATVAGQHALWMATNLLARQFGVVAELRIATPAVELHPGIAILGGEGDLATTLATTARSIAGDDLDVVTVSDGDDGSVAIELVVGAGLPDHAMPAEARVSVLGAGWGAFVGAAVECVPSEALSDPNPFGPYFASCLGTAEVFKRLVGLRPGKGQYVEAMAVSLWDFAEHDSWESMPRGETPARLQLPPFYLVGAGAVGQAAAAVLAAAKVHGHATVIDNDAVDDTNGNRCVLVTVRDEGEAKAPLVARVLRTAGLSAFSYEGTWQSYTLSLPHNEQLPPLQTTEAGYRYELVLSCVDKNTARHAIQKIWPKYLIGGSTDGLSLQVSAYDMLSSWECLKCANPLEVAVGTIEEAARQLRGLPAAERRAILEARGVDIVAIERYLNDPRCGELGERELSRFVTAPDHHDWSVGFVSAAAGVLLAAQLVKLAAGGQQSAFPRDVAHTLRFSFLRPAPRRSFHRRSEECDCGELGRDEWGRLWSSE